MGPIDATLVGIDVTYTVSFKDAMLDVLIDGRVRLQLIDSVMKKFQLKLNDLKFKSDDQSLPGNHFHFSKTYGQTYLDVRYGLEEVATLVRNPVSKDQLIDLLSGVHDLFKDRPITSQVINVQHQLGIGRNPIDYLDSLNPHTPERFKEVLQGKGVVYTLRYVEHDLVIMVTVIPSLFLPEGVFVAINYEFRPSRYDFQKTFEIAENYYSLLLQELNLKVEEAVKHG
jgi:hypothetical protein